MLRWATTPRRATTCLRTCSQGPVANLHLSATQQSNSLTSSTGNMLFKRFSMSTSSASTTCSSLPHDPRHSASDRDLMRILEVSWLNPQLHEVIQRIVHLRSSGHEAERGWKQHHRELDAHSPVFLPPLLVARVSPLLIARRLSCLKEVRKEGKASWLSKPLEKERSQRAAQTSS